jgi:hypothetical protein
VKKGSTSFGVLVLTCLLISTLCVNADGQETNVVESPLSGLMKPTRGTNDSSALVTSTNRMLFHQQPGEAFPTNVLISHGFRERKSGSGLWEKKQVKLGEVKAILGLQTSDLQLLPSGSATTGFYAATFKNGHCAVASKNGLGDSAVVDIAVNQRIPPPSITPRSWGRTFQPERETNAAAAQFTNAQPSVFALTNKLLFNHAQPPASLRDALMERGFREKRPELFERKKWKFGEAQTTLGFQKSDLRDIAGQSGVLPTEWRYEVVFKNARCIIAVSAQEEFDSSSLVDVTVNTNPPIDRGSSKPREP